MDSFSSDGALFCRVCLSNALPGDHMFIVALFVGAYAYALLLLGLLGLLSFWPVTFVSVIFLFLGLYIIWHFKEIFRLRSWSLFEKALGFVWVGFAVLHLFGVLMPEIFYDALWYHLTLPKLYIQEHSFRYIAGNQYYYSAMPQLVEMLYTSALVLGNEITAKLIHYIFAILTSIAIYIAGKKLFSRKVALLAALIFISDLSVAWLSSTAYIDLGRTFFEFTAFYYLIMWIREKKELHLINSGILLGFAISCKYFALGSLFLSSVAILLLAKETKIKSLLRMVIPAITTSLFWFAHAFIHTGSPIYPIFTSNLDGTHHIAVKGVIDYAWQLFKLSFVPHDWLSPISPLYITFVPLIILAARKSEVVKQLALYALGTTLLWYVIPRTGGSRFIVPYLPLFALLASASISFIDNKNFFYKMFTACVLAVITFNGLVRVYVNKKVIPLLIGRQTKQEFLRQNLDLTNTFYDVDGEIERTVPKNERLLIIGGKNLYYVSRPFIHDSFYKNEDVDYILVQYTDLPPMYRQMYQAVYSNTLTQVTLYKKLQQK